MTIFNIFLQQSLENHCSHPQQVRMAEVLKEELREMLNVEQIYNDSATSKTNRLPSPKQLFGKILIKVTKMLQYKNVSISELAFCLADRN